MLYGECLNILTSLQQVPTLLFCAVSWVFLKQNDDIFQRLSGDLEEEKSQNAI